MKQFLYILLLLLLTTTALAYEYPDRGDPLTLDPGFEDLILYPYQFIEDGEFTGDIVIGENAPAQDVTSAIELTVDIQTRARKGAVGTPKLDEDLLTIKNNYIAVGACDNTMTRRIMGIKQHCDFYFNPGEGYVFLYEKDSRYHVVVAGGTPDDTNRAARALAQKEKYGFKGDAIIVKGEDEPYEIIFTEHPDIGALAADEQEVAAERMEARVEPEEEVSATPPIPPPMKEQMEAEQEAAEEAEAMEETEEEAEPEAIAEVEEEEQPNFIVRFFRWIGGWFS